MAQCDCCGSDYEHAFEIEMDGRRYTFDTFQCAISRLAPVCAACGCRVIGKGVDRDSQTYCCAHCAEAPP